MSAIENVRYIEVLLQHLQSSSAIMRQMTNFAENDISYVPIRNRLRNTTLKQILHKGHISTRI